MNIDNYPLWTALITPMFEDGEVDIESLQKLLRQQNEAGNGILILGSTGEALNISDEGKKYILEFALKQNLDVPIMVGVGGINLLDTLKWIDYLNSQPVDCYLLVTPLYAKPGAEGQYHWFKNLMDQSTRPCMLYNVPSRTGTSLSKDAIKRLEGHKNMWAIKEASGSVEEFKSYRDAVPTAQIFSGDDGMMPSFSKENAAGLVSVASNVWPKETKKVVELCLDGKTDAFPEWEKCADALFLASNPIPLKKLMAHLKTIETPAVRPPLSDKDLTSMDEIIDANKKVQEWFKK